MTGRRLSDPRELAALAHPVRIAIVEQLSLDGPMTATELAERLDETPANCSWHLRKLAEHGFVEEAETAGGRRRPWRMAQIGFSWKDGDETPEGCQAALALSEMVMNRSLARLRESDERAGQEPEEWRGAAGNIQSMVWVTAAELRELNDAVAEVVMRFHDRFEDPGARPSGARLCELVAWGVPTYIPGQEPTP